jgi:ABC-type transport system involved in multi-copper enzyme maturation permease subunit
LIIGPVFTRELVTAPRRGRLFLYRTVYAGVLFGVMCTAWLVLTQTQAIRHVGDLAHFGAILFQILAPLQLAIVVFFAALSAAAAVSQEKDRKTLILLLLTRLNNSELVLGKLMASLVHVMTMLLAGLPVLGLTLLFGGISVQQVIRVTLVSVVTALAAGSLGSTLALWREKTFQAIALTALGLVFWILICEAVALGALGLAPAGVDASAWANVLSPLRAVALAARPAVDLVADTWYRNPVVLYLVLASLLTVALNALAIARIRIWNPSREVRAGAPTERQARGSIWGAEHDLDLAQRQARAEQARQMHVDARVSTIAPARHRHVWPNPVLWREVCTWAYGRKVIGIRVAYLVLFVSTVAAITWIRGGQATYQDIQDAGGVFPATAQPSVVFFVVSLVLVNALAVTSITSERDGRSLDLLLVTDLTPPEFLLGKLGGVFWVTKEMVLCPLLLCAYLWWAGQMSTENLVYAEIGLLVLNFFVAMLGVHCGMTYANSRAAIGVSLGTVFFLVLGITVCILMMVSFSGSFHVQLAPFLAFILGGSVGLYASLGIRNPSPAILLASLLLPFATFYAITSYLLHLPLAVFLVTAGAYSFTTAAMMIPALSEFDFAMGRGSVAEE